MVLADLRVLYGGY